MSYLISEIGFNHEGNILLAADMIKAAADAGTDAVKFQTYRAFDIALPSAPDYETIKCGELTFEQYQELYNVAKDCAVEFISTPFSPWAVELLEKVGVSSYKVASMDCTNKHLLGVIAQTGKPIYLSTGMATLAEIADTLDYLKKEKSGYVSILHCISIYPPKAQDLNLSIIPFLKQIFDIPVGYSDHYAGIKACLAAAMLGADIIETHFTLDISRKGADHYHSADPGMIKNLASDIALLKEMKGNPRAIYNRPDRQLACQYRRGVYTARKLSKGDTIKEEDLMFCRPVSQLSPSDLNWLNESVLTQDMPAYNELIKTAVSEK